MSTLTVQLADRSYPVCIKEGILTAADSFRPYILGKQVLLVSNTTVASLYLDSIKRVLCDNYQVDTLVLPDGEQHKNLNTISTIYDALLINKHQRNTTLIAIGGGVVGDMVGFAAATYQRGVNFIQIPTTLLSQVDSSVGGKTGVNHPLGKNMIGAFYQPKAVLIDPGTIETLPGRELSAGLAEVIKYGLIRDPDFFNWLENNMGQLLRKNKEALSYAIETSCRNKAEVVAADELEQGERALLNLGHTFGHAIEAHQAYKVWLHGEAVACGMVIAAEVSYGQGWLSSSKVDQIRGLLHQAGLPVFVPDDMSANHFLEKMQLDKKVVNNKIRYILLKNIGQAVVEENIPIEYVREGIERCIRR